MDDEAAVDQTLAHRTDEVAPGTSPATLRSTADQVADLTVDTTPPDAGDATVDVTPAHLDPDAMPPPEGISKRARRPSPQIDGFRIESVLGRGGMGVVYKAIQISLNRPVALKMILDRTVASEEAVRTI